MLYKALHRSFTAVPALETPYLSQLRQFKFREALKTEGTPVRWIYRELERYVSAYSLGLSELGLTSQDLLVLWLSRKDATEAFVLQFAALAAGVPVHLVDSEDTLATALSRAKGLVFTPWESCKGEVRADFVLGLLPELKQTQHGSLLKSAKFPGVSQVIQTGHSTIRGTIKLKQLPVFADSSQTSVVKPTPTAETLAFEHQRQGKALTAVTQGQLYERISKLNAALALKKEDVLLNTLSPNQPAFFASTLASLVVGGRSVLCGLQQAKKAYTSQQGSVLAYDSSCDFKDHSVSCLIISAADSAEVEQIAKHARDSAKIEAVKVVGVNSSTLELL
jgi:acyl-CoA synthetase (AMP-forming)/AMP-acid ligase II